MTRASRVFISYAHDSDDHVDRVRQFWLLLRTNGVDAHLDLPATSKRRDWPAWMTRQIRKADYVVVVASAMYKERVDGDPGPDRNRGVRAEATLLRELIYADSDRWFPRILPVLLAGHRLEEIPMFLMPVGGTRYQVDRLTVEGAEELLRVLTHQPAYLTGDLGPVPHLPPRSPGSGTPLPPARQRFTVQVIGSDTGYTVRVILAGTSLARLDRTTERLTRMRAGDPVSDLVGADAERTLRELIDRTPPETVVDVVVEAGGELLGLPYGDLRLADGRGLAGSPKVRMSRPTLYRSRAALTVVAASMPVVHDSLDGFVDSLDETADRHGEHDSATSEPDLSDDPGDYDTDPRETATGGGIAAHAPAEPLPDLGDLDDLSDLSDLNDLNEPDDLGADDFDSDADDDFDSDSDSYDDSYDDLGGDD